MTSRSKALPRNQVLVGDARTLLQTLPQHSIDCVVTSPPYYLLRDYGVSDQIGLEESVSEWVDELRLAMRALARVIKPSGTLWLNLGDTYSRHPRYGAPPKSLLLGPERLGLALIEDGWVVRNKIVWSKTNPMPSSVRDRLTCTWEVIYVLVRNRSYQFDLDGIRVPATTTPPKRKTTSTHVEGVKPAWAGPLAGSNVGLKRLKVEGLVSHSLGKNPGDVWSMAAANFRGQHFATFPPALVERMLRAGCPERVCRACGEAWSRNANHQIGALAIRRPLKPRCTCGSGWQPGIVLDPFSGVGTVGLIADQLGRDWLGIELNSDFARLAEERIYGAGGSPRPMTDALVA